MLSIARLIDVGSKSVEDSQSSGGKKTAVRLVLLGKSEELFIVDDFVDPMEKIPKKYIRSVRGRNSLKSALMDCSSGKLEADHLVNVDSRNNELDGTVRHPAHGQVLPGVKCFGHFDRQR